MRLSPALKRSIALASSLQIVFLLLTSSPSVGVEPFVGAQATGGVRCSVIVPAFREAANMRALVTRTLDTLANNADELGQAELVIVNDVHPDDDTWVEVSRLRGSDKRYLAARVIERTKDEGSGLSSAVLRGFEEARGDKFVVMDG